MVINPTPSVKRFCETLGEAVGLRRPLRSLLVMFVMGILLARGKRSLAALGSAVLRTSRYRGQVSRASRNPDFKTLDLYRCAFASALGAADGETVSGRSMRTWFLALDDVSTKRGGFTKIENGFHPKKAKKNPGRKQPEPPSKLHTFVMGLILTESGQRIPLPRKTWRTKGYARKIGKKYLSKLELAEQMLRSLKPMLPRDVQLVVLTDEWYESRAMIETCRQLGFVFIAPVDSRRTFGDVPRDAGARVRTIQVRGKALPRSAFRQVVLARGQEETASYRRYTPDEAEREDTRTFRVSHEVRDVAGLGCVGVVYSWKSPVYRPRRSTRRETFKVLVCSDPSLPAEVVAEFYDLRWQIELFFRELKSGLGLADYTGIDFGAFERLVDLTMLSFLYLEDARRRRLLAETAPVVRARLVGSRTAELKREVEREAMATDVDWLTASLSSERGRRRLRSVLRRLRVAA